MGGFDNSSALCFSNKSRTLNSLCKRNFRVKTTEMGSRKLNSLRKRNFRVKTTEMELLLLVASMRLCSIFQRCKPVTNMRRSSQLTLSALALAVR